MAKRIYVGVPTEAGTKTVDVALREGNVGEFFAVNDGASPFAWSGSAYVAGRETSQSKSETFTSAWTARTDIESVTLDWEVIGGSGPFTMEVNGQSVANSELNDSGTWSGTLSAGGVVEFGFVLGSGATGTANVEATVKTQRETASGNVARKVRKLYVGVGGIANRRLPEGYTQAEYVESDGASYFDTGFVPNQDTKVMMEALIPTVPPSSIATLFGARPDADSATDCVSVLCTTSGSVRSYYDDSYKAMLTISEPIRLSVLKDRESTSINAATATHTYAEFSAAGNLFLSAMNAGGVATWHAALRIYSCSVYDNDKTVRFYVPCISPDGVVGLFDLVSMEFNAGVGSFTAGPTVATEEYNEQGIARKVRKAYVGVGGVARPFWGGGELAYYGTATALRTARYKLAAATAGGYAIFAGGTASSYDDTVDAYDASLTRTKPSYELSESKNVLYGASVGKYALFGGGSNTGYTKTVEAYDSSLTRSQEANLSTAKSNLATVSTGSYALFGGGSAGSSLYATVDAYNSSLTKSTPSPLSSGRQYLGAAMAGDYALFGGGFVTTANSTVDAYNPSLTRSTPSVLSATRYFIAAAAAGNCAVFAGGALTSSTFSNVVDGYDSSLTRKTLGNLSQARKDATAVGVGDFALFCGGQTTSTKYFATVDVYDSSLTKSVATNLNKARTEAAAAALGDLAIIGGGRTSTTASSAIVDVYTIV